MIFTDHISKQFDADLEAVRARVLQMGGLVESQILEAIHALQSGDLEHIERVILQDSKVNDLEVAIDNDCQNIIARRQPAASDLRMVLTIIKTITDLERIGDEAQKIARIARTIHESGRMNAPRFSEIKHVSELVVDMLRQALDSFARLDLTNTTRIVRQDLQVDEEFRAILRQLITFMMEDPRTISASLDIIFMAKAIERIGDHAKNISEYVVYLIKCKDVRHVSLEEIERATSS